ncbi:membrane dipeptidase-domain-containing protein [Calycina marina]|uniref:Dipeptidase n=1 Tax=Calycina marina TaxID=1763456 RepID=A0A9P8CBE2_9HELO|nr:membrane dipeptidase-domain-containing protein [Calycina marina]
MALYSSNDEKPLLRREKQSSEVPVHGHYDLSKNWFPKSLTFKRVGLVLLLVFLLNLIRVSLFVGVLEKWGETHDTTPKSLEHRVKKILKTTPLIDGHNDLAILIRYISNNQIYNDNFTIPFEQGGFVSHVDLPRLREGMNGGAFWSAYAPCPSNGSNFSDANYASSVAFTLKQIDILTRLFELYPEHFASPPSLSTKAAIESFKNGKLISPIGIEGLHQIGNSIANLRHFHSLGVRYSTLSHNCHNIYVDAAITENPLKKATPYWNGVSPAGRDLIKEMNRIGMIVDLAHVSQDTMRDVLGGGPDWTGSEAPIIFSHSSAFSICPHPRNVPDDILQLVKRRNSLVMVNFSGGFISCTASDNANGMPDFYAKNNTLAQVVSHIKYIGDLIGYDHVGLGSDFDGILDAPAGLEDVSKFPDLVAELLRQGISDKHAGLIVGGNVLRVWADVEAVSEKLKEAGLQPLEDQLPPLRW